MSEEISKEELEKESNSDVENFVCFSLASFFEDVRHVSPLKIRTIRSLKREFSNNTPVKELALLTIEFKTFEKMLLSGSNFSTLKLRFFDIPIADFPYIEKYFIFSSEYLNLVGFDELIITSDRKHMRVLW